MLHHRLGLFHNNDQFAVHYPLHERGGQDANINYFGCWLTPLDMVPDYIIEGVSDVAGEKMRGLIAMNFSFIFGLRETQFWVK